MLNISAGVSANKMGIRVMSAATSTCSDGSTGMDEHGKLMETAGWRARQQEVPECGRVGVRMVSMGIMRMTSTTGDCGSL